MLMKCAASAMLLWFLSVRVRTQAQVKVAINWQGYKRLKAGMTAGEVEAHLGCPPGNYGKVDLSLASTNAVRCWMDDEVILQVWFKSDGSMFAKQVFLVP